MVRHEATGNQLTDMFINHFSQVAHLYEGQNPRELSSYAVRAERIAASFDNYHRKQLVETLTVYGSSIGASEGALQQISRFADPRSVAVVTGQQAGLFTGPFYSVAKALTAIGAAKVLEERLQRPVIPVFWVASEDHDWDEVNHTYVLDAQQDVQRIVLAKRPVPHQMVYHAPLDAGQVLEAIQAVHQLLPEGPYHFEMLEVLKSTWQTGDSLSTWFARLHSYLFANHGLVLLDPCLPKLRDLVKNVFVNALSHFDEVQAALGQAYQEVIQAGFQPEVVRDETNSTVFYVEDGKRFVLEISGPNRLRARGLGVERTVEEWIALAETNPTSFSSNVLLRPVVQDALLPTLTYVGGPSEIAYHSLSRAVFRIHGRMMPPLLLRQRMTLYPPAVARSMKARNIELEDVLQPVDFVHPFIEEQGGQQVGHTLTALSQQIANLFLAWGKEHAQFGPQIAEMVDAQIRREEEGLHRLRKKTMRLIEQRYAADLHQLRQIERWLWTDGHAQERRLSPLNVWSQFGASLFSHLPTWGDFSEIPPVYHIFL